MHYEGGITKISHYRKICIIGAGASGLAAAISAAKAGASVCVLEQSEKAAVKLERTGNGKCNFTNLTMDPSCYYASENSRIADWIKDFGPQKAIDFFASLGIASTQHFGYVYPESENAMAVRHALLQCCRELSVELRTGETIGSINELRDTYDRVILATGSRAQSKIHGYHLLEQMGQPYTRVLPALCPLHWENSWGKSPSGLRVVAAITLRVDGAFVAAETGELQFTKERLSGIPILQVSRWISRALDEKKQVILEICFEPEEDALPVIVRTRPHSYLSSIDYDAGLPAHRMCIPVTKMPEFQRSQVCTGGIAPEDLTEDMELKHFPGVYAVGELCDVDGKCGGYNLHWAWLSGMRAGKAAAE